MTADYRGLERAEQFRTVAGTGSSIAKCASELAEVEELCSEGPTYGRCNILTGSHQGMHVKRKECLFWNPQPFEPENLAKFFHETYERLAPQFGYETRKESAKPWSDVPLKNKRLMIAVCAEVLKEARPVQQPDSKLRQAVELFLTRCGTVNATDFALAINDLKGAL